MINRVGNIDIYLLPKVEKDLLEEAEI